MLNTVALLSVLLVGVCVCSVVDVDLSYEVNEDSTHWFKTDPYTRKTHHNGYTDNGFWLESYSFCSSEHLSTHLDAPSHFARGKWTVSDIPLEHLVTGKGIVVDIRDKVKEDSSAELMADDLMAWMDKHGPLPDGAVVFVLTGWGSRYGNKSAYFGVETYNASQPGNLTFPGINPGAAQLLAGYEKASGRRVFGVGIDTASLDHGPSKTFQTHVELSNANIFGIENVANMQELPPKDFEVLVMPVKLTGGSGAPARVVARINGDTSGTMSFSRTSCHYFFLVLAALAMLKLL